MEEEPTHPIARVEHPLVNQFTFLISFLMFCVWMYACIYPRTSRPGYIHSFIPPIGLGNSILFACRVAFIAIILARARAAAESCTHIGSEQEDNKLLRTRIEWDLISIDD